MNNEKTSPLTSLKTGRGLRCHRACTVIDVLITEYSVNRMVHTGTDYIQCVYLKTPSDKIVTVNNLSIRNTELDSHL